MALHRDIYWVGRQWAVTGYGMQAVDPKLKGQFDIEAIRLWEDGLSESLNAGAWLNAEDFAKALSVARARYPQPSGKPEPSQEGGLSLTLGANRRSGGAAETTGPTICHADRTLAGQIPAILARARSAIAARNCRGPRKWPAFESQCRGPPFNPFILKFPMFFKVSSFEHSLSRGKRHSQPSPSAPWQIGNQSVQVRHARISAGIVSGYCRDRATALPELPAEPHAAVEAGAGTRRLRPP